MPDPVWNIYRDESRSEIKCCNPKNQIRDHPEKKWYLPVSQSGCGIKSGINTPLFWHAKGREFIMPPRRTGFNEYMPQGQRTLTEVDGVVEIGPVGPATQKEVAPAQANTSRKRDAAEAAAQPAAARRAARGHATAAQGRSDRQPAATAAQQGGSSSGKLGQVANINTTTPTSIR